MRVPNEYGVMHLWLRPEKKDNITMDPVFEKELKELTKKKVELEAKARALREQFQSDFAAIQREADAADERIRQIKEKK